MCYRKAGGVAKVGRQIPNETSHCELIIPRALVLSAPQPLVPYPPQLAIVAHHYRTFQEHGPTVCSATARSLDGFDLFGKEFGSTGGLGRVPGWLHCSLGSEWNQDTGLALLLREHGVGNEPIQNHFAGGNATEYVVGDRAC